MQRRVIQAAERQEYTINTDLEARILGFNFRSCRCAQMVNGKRRSLTWMSGGVRLARRGGGRSRIPLSHLTNTPSHYLSRSFSVTPFVEISPQHMLPCLDHHQIC
jgi:hypothetical protein